MYFVNSGSDANDLAMLMARMHTQKFEVLSFRLYFCSIEHLDMISPSFLHLALSQMGQVSEFDVKLLLMFRVQVRLECYLIGTRIMELVHTWWVLQHSLTGATVFLVGSEFIRSIKLAAIFELAAPFLWYDLKLYSRPWILMCTAVLGEGRIVEIRQFRFELQILEFFSKKLYRLKNKFV